MIHFRKIARAFKNNLSMKESQIKDGRKYSHIMTPGAQIVTRRASTRACCRTHIEFIVAFTAVADPANPM